jgi:hypothetical protein
MALGFYIINIFSFYIFPLISDVKVKRPFPVCNAESVNIKIKSVNGILLQVSGKTVNIVNSKRQGFLPSWVGWKPDIIGYHQLRPLVGVIQNIYSLYLSPD